jgi:hypothetical protein
MSHFRSPRVAKRISSSYSPRGNANSGLVVWKLPLVVAARSDNERIMAAGRLASSPRCCSSPLLGKSRVSLPCFNNHKPGESFCPRMPPLRRANEVLLLQEWRHPMSRSRPNAATWRRRPIRRWLASASCDSADGQLYSTGPTGAITGCFASRQHSSLARPVALFLEASSMRRRLPGSPSLMVLAPRHRARLATSQ